MLIPKGFLDVEFGKSMAFGYKTTDVDIFVDAAIELLNEFEKENIKLTETLEKTRAELKSYKDDENTLRQALIGSQKLGDSLIHKAKVQADEIIAEATKKANDIINAVEEQKLQKEYEYNRTKTEVSKFKNDLLTLYKQHLEILQLIPEESDAPKNNHIDSDIQNDTIVNNPIIDEDEDLSYIKDDEFYLNRIKHYETLTDNEAHSDDLEKNHQNDDVSDNSLNNDNSSKDNCDSNAGQNYTELQNSEDDSVSNFEDNSNAESEQEDISKTEHSDADNSLSEDIGEQEAMSNDDDSAESTDIENEDINLTETEVTENITDETETQENTQTEKKLFDTLICEQIETSVVLNEDDDYNMFLTDIDLEEMNIKQMDLFSDESEDEEEKLTC